MLDYLTILKIIVTLFIVASPFINYTPLQFFNLLGVKILLIVSIVLASFLDLQLAILMTLALLILIIHLNKASIFGKKEHFVLKNAELVTEFPDTCTDMSHEPTEISKDLYSFYIDPKIKPYEMYIQALSPPDMVEKASSGAF